MSTIRKQVNLKSGHKVVVFEYKPFRGSPRLSFMVIGTTGSMSVKTLDDVRRVIREGKV